MSQVVLADEINRATPKTQSALLECMEERQATIDGTTYPMPDPFLVIATQNPIEYEGTFALPEAQLDRFMLRLRLGYPAAHRGDRHPRRAEADAPARRARGGRRRSRSSARCRRPSARSTSTRPSRTTSSASSTATRNHPDVYLGASPRGSIALYRAGQALAATAGPGLRHPRRRQGPRRTGPRPPADHQDQLLDPRRPGRTGRARAARDDVGRWRSGRPGPAARASSRGVPGQAIGPRARRTEIDPGDARRRSALMIRRLEVLILATILVVAAFSTGDPFLFYLLYLAILIIGGSYVLVRLGLTDLEAGYAVSQLHGHVGDKLRVTYTMRNSSRLPKLWLEIHNPTTLPGALPGRALTLPGRSERSWLIRVPLSRRGHFRIEPLHIRTGDPFGFFEAAATVGQGVSVVVYPRLEPIPALAPPVGRPRGQPRVPGADPSDDPAGHDGPALRPGRQHEPHPLALDRAARGDPGQGIRPRADRRRLDRARPPARHRRRPRRRIDHRSRHPGGRGHLGQGDRREPCRRDDRQRQPNRIPPGRPRRPPAPEDHAAPRGGRGRREHATRGDAHRDRRAAAPWHDRGGHHPVDGHVVDPPAREPATRAASRASRSPSTWRRSTRFAREAAASIGADRPAPDAAAEEAIAKRQRALRHALAEYELPTYTLIPGRPLGELLFR